MTDGVRREHITFCVILNSSFSFDMISERHRHSNVIKPRLHRPDEADSLFGVFEPETYNK